MSAFYQDYSSSPNRDYFGDGVIAGESPGIVTVAGSPASRRVALYDADNLALLKRTGSDSAGLYRFEHLDRGRQYFVVAFDHTGQFNAVIRDNITPAPMP